MKSSRLALWPGDHNGLQLYPSLKGWPQGTVLNLVYLSGGVLYKVSTSHLVTISLWLKRVATMFGVEGGFKKIRSGEKIRDINKASTR